MKSFSNTYIFIFSAIMVIVVAALLAFVASKLKDRQDRNVRVEQIQSILHSVQIESTTKNAEDLFNKYVKESYVINQMAERIEGIEALDVDLKKEVAKIEMIKKLQSSIQQRRISPFKEFVSGIIEFKEVDKSSVKKEIEEVSSERKLPVFVLEKESGTYYVFPLQGKGLWGPIWGFISLEDDMNTIYGAVFDHKTETPGLGAEITESWFEDTFIGKKLYQDGNFRSVEVIKGGADDDNLYGVDAISGGTITSKGVEAMVYDCLISYENFFEIKRN